MSEFSAEFVFVPTLSFSVTAEGELVRPFPGEGIGPNDLVNKYVYAFVETQGGTDAWQLAALYKVLPRRGPGGFPLVGIVVGTDSNGADLLSEASETVMLPSAKSGGIDDPKYFFLCLDHLLLPDTEAALAKERDVAPLPIVSLKGVANALFVGADGTYDTGPSPDLRPAVQVVDPYAVGVQLSRTLEIRCNAVVAYTKPEAGLTDTEELATKVRLAKQSVALQLDALQKAGKDFKSKLRGGQSSLKQFLKDVDPNQPDGELGRLIRKREDFALAVINMTTGRLWNLLERDARATAERARQHYGRHLQVTCDIHKSLATSELGEDYWHRVCVCFPIESEEEKRQEPKDGVEEIARRFIFAEKASVEPKEGWEEPALLKGGNAAFSLYAALTKVIARASLEKVGDAAGGVISSQELDDFASGALRSKAGLTAYRWAYHLRNNFFVERVTLEGVEKAVTWVDNGRTFTASTVELTFQADGSEFAARFANSGFDFEHVGRLMNIASFGFSVMALNTALEKKAKDLDVKILQTGSAALSLAGDDLVVRLFEKLEKSGGSGRGAKVVKFMGTAGAVLGGVAGIVEASQARDNGEGDVAIVTGGGALIGSVVAAWAAVAALGVVSGPPGWVMLAGTAVGLIAPIVSAAFLQDDALENMVEHCVFGKQHGQPHDAPKIALCANDKFDAWAGESLLSLEAQRIGFANFIWAFRVKGLRTTNPMRSDPTVEILPPRMTPETCVDVEVDITWRQGEEEVHLRGMVRLFCKKDENFEHLSGDRFAGTGHGLPKVHTTRNPATHRIEWTIEPADPILREKVQQMPVKNANLALQLRALGPSDDTMVFPKPHFSNPTARFEYQLMRIARLNRDEVSSVSIYA